MKVKDATPKMEKYLWLKRPDGQKRHSGATAEGWTLNNLGNRKGWTATKEGEKRLWGQTEDDVVEALSRHIGRIVRFTGDNPPGAPKCAIPWCGKKRHSTDTTHGYRNRQWCDKHRTSHKEHRFPIRVFASPLLLREDVEYIHADYKRGMSTAELAKKYEVSKKELYHATLRYWPFVKNATPF